MTAQHSTQQQLSHDIFDFLMDMHKETRFSCMKLNKDKMLKTIESILSSGFVYFDGKCLFMGRAFNPWYSDEIHANDFIMYTKNEFRGQGLAKIAIKQFIKWARSIGASDISVARSSGINKKSFEKMAEDLNLNRIGEIYNVQR